MKPQWTYRIPLAVKMALTMLLVVVTVFFIVKWQEAESLKDFFIDDHLNALEKESQEGLLRFNKYLNARTNSVKFLVTQKHFLDYLESFKKNTSIEKEKINIRHYGSLPPWFPSRSLTRAFFQSSYALLIDAYGRVREVYQGFEKPIPQSLLYPDELLPRMIKSGSLLTFVDGYPFQLVIQRIKDPGDQLLAILMFAFPVDSDFIRDSQGRIHNNRVVALLNNDKHIIASSAPNLISKGETIESLGKEYIAVGKSFICYGGIDIDIKFISLVPKKRIDLFVNKVLSEEFKYTGIYGIAFILTSALVALFWAGKIKKLTNGIVDFLKTTLGIEYSVRPQKDELYTLQTSFHQLENSIITAHNRLKTSKQDWENTFNTITDMITIHDKDFNIVLANKAASKILGLPALSVSKEKCFKYYHGKEQPPQGCPSCECLKTGRPELFEIYEPHLKMFLEIRAIPRFDKNNRLTGLIHVARDITERKKAEKEIIQTQKLSSLGKMLAGIGHEIKNPLEGIGMVLQSMQNSFGEQDIRRQDILRILNEIKRLEKLLDNIVRFSRPRALNLQKADITVSVENSLILVKKALIDKNIKVEKCYFHNGLKILFDAEAMQQVFINLFLNAIESMNSNHGVLTINIKEIRDGLPGSPAAFNGKSRKWKSGYIKRGIQVLIRDTGCGIKEEDLEKIFEPYFTTTQKKSGLGLYIVHQIVRGHKGRVDIYSKEGEGTSFAVILPLSDDINNSVYKIGMKDEF
jgi:PAS domain S-box-containing protein